MKHFLQLLIFCILFFNQILKAQTDSFVVDGIYRNFILHLPSGYSPSISYPLVLNLHGYTSNASQEQLYTKFDQTSNANQFMVVYPNGVGNYWNSFNSGVDDVKFLRNLIDTISKRYKVNAKRVYSCGMSNGGFMSYTLACQMSDKLAAVASVTGTMSNPTLANCPITHKMPILHIHGTTDSVVNYNTGVTGSAGVEQVISFWKDTNGCTLKPDTTNILNTSTTDSCTAQLIRYKNCKNGSEVQFYKITGGGHTWPNAALDIPSNGNTNRDFDASNAIWEFFNRFTLDGPTNVGIENIDLSKLVTIYPNPFTNEIKISTDETIKQLEIFDVLGNKIQEEKWNNTSLNTKNIPSGIYLLRISLERGEVVKRIVKN